MKKISNESETNELIKKIYGFEGEEIIFNKNEINKIGILLLNYIRLEKKYNDTISNLYFYKEKLNKLKDAIKILCNKALDKIADSNNFINQYIIDNNK